MKFIIFLVGTLAAGVAVPSMLLADIYKYVDKDGVIHFSNVPTTEGKWVLVIKEKRVHFNLGKNFEKYDPEIWKASQKYSVDYNLVKAVIKAESNFNPKAVSRAGARGLMQLRPQTANRLQVNDSFHPEENIDGGVRYLRYLMNLYNDNLQLALAAYNAGEKAVFKYRGIPPYQETQTYVQRVLRYYQEYSRETRSPVQPSHSEN
ncbi:MAG: lytic transglycosylase domain-containing protein [Deltaproteobacteria bacterium]|nr:lytic transglycosylase domain-containing protein [Deltaproteobacteria bacterium]